MEIDVIVIERIKHLLHDSAAFDLTVGFATDLTSSEVSTSIAEKHYMTDPSQRNKPSNEPVGNLAYIEPLQVLHYGGGTWRMATK